MKINLTIQEIQKILRDKYGEAEFVVEFQDETKPEPKPKTIITFNNQGITKEEIKK